LLDNRSITEEELTSGEPIGRMGRPEEIAEGVLWLMSDASSFVTGHPLVIDGAWVAR
jgi:NAD(P)-dependent dehydrogenase (short-subunit alcohol dehydrogenase family)